MGVWLAGNQREYVGANKRAKRGRRTPTPAEKRLWRHLRKLEGFHFRRQVPMGPYVYDFGDLSRRMLIEVDGGIHALPDVIIRDQAKAAWAESQGFRLVRIPNDWVFGSGGFALAEILCAATKAT